MIHRSNSFTTTAATGYTTPSSGTATAYAPGGVVAVSSTGNTITLHPGHGFVGGEKFMRGIDANTYSGVRTVQSVSGNVLNLDANYTVDAGDRLVNLGVDSSNTIPPNYNGSSIVTYSNPGGTATNAQAIVALDEGGNYEYWHNGDRNIWELVRDGAGDPVAIVIDAFTLLNEKIHFGVREAHLYATGGTGTLANPWTGWENVFAGAIHTHFVSGTYRTDVQTTISDLNELVTGDGAGTVILSRSASGCFKVDLPETNAANFTMRDLTIQQNTNSLASGAKLLDIEETNRFILDNISLLGDSTTNLISLGTALAITQPNMGWVYNLHIRAFNSPNNFAIGIDIGKAITENRGNISFFGGFIERCTTAVRLANGASNMLNNIQFYGTKMRHDSGVGVNQTPVAGTLGFDIYSQAFLVTLSGVHIEWYENALRASGVTGLITENCIISGYGGGTVGAILLNNNCDHIRIKNNLFTNGVAAQAGVYGIELDASSHNFLDIGPNRYIYGAGATTEPNQVLNNSLTTCVGQAFFDNTKKWQFRDIDVWIGRGVDESMNLNFDVATGVSRLRWAASASRFEISRETLIDGILRANGAIIGTSRVDVGSFLRLPISTTLTIATGVVTADLSNHKIDTEAAAASDDLDTINGGGQDGQILVLRAANSGRTVNVTEAGNIKLGANPRALDNTEDKLVLMWDGAAWCELSFSDIGA